MLLLLVRVNDNVDLVLALPLAHLWVFKTGGARHSPGVARQVRLQYPGGHYICVCEVYNPDLPQAGKTYSHGQQMSNPRAQDGGKREIL
jgi:hypothetical protein